MIAPPFDDDDEPLHIAVPYPGDKIRLPDLGRLNVSNVTPPILRDCRWCRGDQVEIRGATHCPRCDHIPPEPSTRKDVITQ